MNQRFFNKKIQPLREDFSQKKLLLSTNEPKREINFDPQSALSVLNNSLNNLHSFLIVKEHEKLGHIHRYNIPKEEREKLLHIRESVLRLIEMLNKHGYGNQIKDLLQNHCGALLEFLSKGDITYNTNDIFYHHMQEFALASDKSYKMQLANTIISLLEYADENQRNSFKIILSEFDYQTIKDLKTYLTLQ
ncbi:MAG: hypothetical protein N3E37_05115 [Candidatus Micrarchaeota archaeon]|nr:hypothetical protein [Candidatus Micrarchaeota archaeon]